MGSAISRTLLNRAPSTTNALPYSGDLVTAEEKKQEKSEKVNYMNLPCPVCYRDLHFEASCILKPTDFQGLNFILVNKLNEKFFIAHKFIMESLEVPRLRANIFEIRPANVTVSTGDYEFGSFYNDSKLLIAGKLNIYGPVMACLKYNFTNNFSCDIKAKLTNEPHCSHGAFQFDYEGKDYRSQFRFGNKGLYVANYIQSVSPNLSLGTQLLWLGDQTKSIIDFSARYSANKMIASGRVSCDGSISLSYVQNFSEKVTFASEFMYAPSTRNVISSFGYEYKFGECLLRGKVDCNAVISSYYERKVYSGTRLLLCAQIDHVKKYYKFGYGLEFVSDKPAIVYKCARYCINLLTE